MNLRDETARAGRIAYRDGQELCPFDKADPLIQKTWLRVADQIIALLNKQVQDAGWVYYEPTVETQTDTKKHFKVRPATWGQVVSGEARKL